MKSRNPVWGPASVTAPGLAIIGIGWIGIAFFFARLDGEAKSLNHDLSTTVFGKINLIAGYGISVSFTTAASIAGFIGLAFLIIAFCLYKKPTSWEL